MEILNEILDDFFGKIGGVAMLQFLWGILVVWSIFSIFLDTFFDEKSGKVV